MSGDSRRQPDRGGHDIESIIFDETTSCPEPLKLDGSAQALHRDIDLNPHELVVPVTPEFASLESTTEGLQVCGAGGQARTLLRLARSSFTTE